jgi:phosphomannomutase
VIRPSGTEPKLKAYLEVVVGGAGKAEGAEALGRLRAEIAALMGA